MIALDTNLLVYAHREDSPWHEPALRLVTALAEASAAWAIPWPSIHEFLAIVSHPRIYAPPTPLASALEQVDAWLESPSLVMIGEAEGYWLELRRTLETSRATGPKVPDARIAALCAHHGVRELWSANRDFSRFDGVTVVNPLVRRSG